MKRTGLYPGTFDPATNGHLDIIGRAVKLVDKLVIGVAVDTGKAPLFTLEERMEIAREETEWRFVPDVPWSARDYRIVIRTTLEDLAGNHINRPFDVDTFDPITKSVSSETVSLRVRPR